MIGARGAVLPKLSIRPLAESALLIRIGEGERADPMIVSATAALAREIETADLPGIVEIVPAYSTVLVGFDPTQTEPATLVREVGRLAASSVGRVPGPARRVTIPVAYGGVFGPDLGDVAAHTGLTPDEVISRHAGGDYLVACMGFAPGWAYLLGLPAELAMPRLPTPRTRIPAGSVALGGAQTGVYPLETPGGWRLLGRTPIRLFDPIRVNPFLLQPGDRVRFEPISEGAFSQIEAEVTAKSFLPQVERLSDG